LVAVDDQALLVVIRLVLRSAGARRAGDARRCEADVVRLHRSHRIGGPPPVNQRRTRDARLRATRHRARSACLPLRYGMPGRHVLFATVLIVGRGPSAGGTKPDAAVVDGPLDGIDAPDAEGPSGPARVRLMAGNLTS